MATEAEAGRAWARDLLETELERAGEEGLTKSQLQEGLSIGTDDLRAGLAALEEEDLLLARGDRYVLRADELAVGQRPDADLEAAAETEAEALDEVLADEDADALDDVVPPSPVTEPVPGLAEVADQVAAAEGFYRARIMLDVSFKPDTPGDERAVGEARDLRTLAEMGILGRYPDLAVSSGVVSVDAFDNPRHVWP